MPILGTFLGYPHAPPKWGGRMITYISIERQARKVFPIFLGGGAHFFWGVNILLGQYFFPGKNHV